MKKFFVFALCMLAVSINYSCGDEEEPVPGPTPGPTPSSDISYYSYNVKYNSDVQTILDLMNVQLYLCNGETENAKTLLSADKVYQDSVLLDYRKNYYYGIVMDAKPIAALNNTTMRDYLNSKSYKETLVPYLLEELSKRGMDVKKLNLVADFPYKIEVVDEKNAHSDKLVNHISANYDALKAASPSLTDEEIINMMFEFIRSSLYDMKDVRCWDATTLSLTKIR